MVSNGIANHYRGPPCRTQYLVMCSNLVRDVVRAVEITPASQRDKWIPIHLATGGPHMTVCVRNATYARLRIAATVGQEPEVELALG
jgi:hypothetical protein